MQTKIYNIVLASFLLVGCMLSFGCACNISDLPRNSTWYSSDPDIWFIVNEDGTTKGELKYNDEVTDIEVNRVQGWLGISVIYIMQYDDYSGEGDLIGTSIRTSSNTKLVLDVKSSTIQGFDVKQIIFIRGD